MSESFLSENSPRQLWQPSDFISTYSAASTLSQMITGDGGDNRLIGTLNNETIQGGAGDDMLIGNGGADLLTGGDGRDRFTFSPGQSTQHSTTTITDFDNGSLGDYIEISDLAGYDFVHQTSAYSSLDAGLAAVRALSGDQLVAFTVEAASTDSYLYLAANGPVEETLIRLQDHDGQYLSRHDGSLRTLLQGSDGDDVIQHSGSLDSYMDGGSGDDQLYGGSHYDRFLAGEGNDRFDGRDGDDMLDTSAGAAIVNGSGSTLVVNGISVATGESAGLNARAEARLGRDRFSNIEAVLGGDRADYIATGDTLRHAYGGAGDDLLLDKAGSWSNLYGGSGRDRFVFQEGENISTSAYDLLADFDAAEDQLIFVTDGTYQLAEQVLQFDASLKRADLLASIHADAALNDTLVFIRHGEESLLLVNGDGGQTGASLHNTLLVLRNSSLDDLQQVSAAISFVTEIPDTIESSASPVQPDEVRLIIEEPDSGTLDHYFLLSMKSVASEVIRLWYETSGGTATAGSDYEAVSGWVTIEAGQSSAAIAVPIMADTVAEPDETLELQVSDPSGRWLANGVTLTAEHIIRDSDLLLI